MGATLLALAVPAHALPEGIVGPLLGHVGPDRAHIWVRPNLARQQVWVRYWAQAQPEGVLQVPMRWSPTERGVVRVVLGGLRPSTKYVYQVVVDGHTNAWWTGCFSTAPPLGSPTRFRMAFSSCAKSDRAQDSWTQLLAQRPALHLLLGDNVYSNSTQPGAIWREHVRIRRKAPFAAVIRNVPTYATWDDHDYGSDNSDGTLPGKERSLGVFREVFANPSAGLPGVPGVFFRFAWGDVEFFVLDNRYWRSPNDAPDDSRKRMLGDAQFFWLREGLRASKARFKVIASGSTLRLKGEDSWSGYTFARRRIFDAIRTLRAGGVLWLSGDLHRCTIDVHPASETGFYDLVEVISSGIANSDARAFVTLDFDTTVSDPTLRIRIRNGDGTVTEDRTLSLSALRIR